MPELPDLEVIREFLSPRVVDVPVESAQVRRPIVVRNLLGRDVSGWVKGSRFTSVTRRGKFLLLTLDAGVMLVINPMLAGRIRYGFPLGRHRARDALVLHLADGHELRYHDAKDMGKIYLTDDAARIPAFAGQGPDATDPELTLDVFRQRLRRYRGAIKGVLTNQAFVAGIGNAYSDEICWRAGLYPFRKRPSLTDSDVVKLHGAVGSVLTEAMETLRSRVGDSIDVEVRDFLAVHGKAGEPCLACGGIISEVKWDRRVTNFCRTCQPGLSIGGSEVS